MKERVGGSDKWLAFASFAGAYLLSGFLRSSNAVIAGDLSEDLNLSTAQLGFMTAAFFVPFAAAQLPVGGALDRYGARVVVPSLMMLAAIGTLVMAIAPGFAMMATGRAILGLGVSGILMGGFKALSTHFPGRRFTAVSAELVAFGAVGGLLAATPLAWLNDLIGWRAVFELAALALALGAGAVALWGSAPFPGKPHDGEGLRRIFASSRFWRLAFSSFILVGVLLAVQGLWVGPYLTQEYGLTQSAAGNILVALNVGLLLGYLLSGWLGQRYGLVRTSLAAFAAFLLLQLLLALQPPAGAGVLTLLFLLFGLTGSFHVLLYKRGEELFPPRMTGHVVTAVNLFMFAGGFALQSLLGLVIEGGGSQGDPSYGLAFLLTAALSGVALVALLPELRKVR